MEAKIKTEPKLAEMEPEEFKKIFYNLMENGKKVEQEFRTDWINNTGLKGYLTDGGAIMTLEFPNGRILECRELYGKDVTIERRPSRSKELAKVKEEQCPDTEPSNSNMKGNKMKKETTYSAPMLIAGANGQLKVAFVKALQRGNSHAP